jgi:hypothetical protein
MYVNAAMYYYLLLIGHFFFVYFTLDYVTTFLYFKRTNLYVVQLSRRWRMSRDIYVAA